MCRWKTSRENTNKTLMWFELKSSVTSKTLIIDKPPKNQTARRFELKHIFRTKKLLQTLSKCWIDKL